MVKRDANSVADCHPNIVDSVSLNVNYLDIDWIVIDSATVALDGQKLHLVLIGCHNVVFVPHDVAFDTVS